MHGWKNAADTPAPLTRLLGLVLLLASAGAWAEHLFVRQAESYLDGDLLRLDADIDLHLPQDVLEGLHNGLPVTLVMEIQILRQRDWLWDETLAHLEQRYRLTYLPLAQLYRVENLNSGARYAYPRLELALNHIGHPRGLPLLKRRLLLPGARHLGAMRVAIDPDPLPISLRLLSHFGGGWRSSSDWYRWPIATP